MVNKILCLYSYYEKNAEYKRNFEFFLEKGINVGIDYKIIVNGTCSVLLPEKANIEVIYRDNVGFDFGSYAYYINRTADTLQTYTHFIFINNSVRGPYGAMPWHTQFIDMINDTVKLVGISINILTYFDKRIAGFELPYPHVQSMMFAMDLEALTFLKDSIFGLDVMEMTNKEEVVLKKEILMSLLILRKGWKINCTLSKYKDLDYANLKQDINPTSFFGDPSYKHRYFGSTYTPADGAVFIKSDPMRQLLPVERVKPVGRAIL